jgi:6-methylsalicylate decarboxylase
MLFHHHTSRRFKHQEATLLGFPPPSGRWKLQLSRWTPSGLHSVRIARSVNPTNANKSTSINYIPGILSLSTPGVPIVGTGEKGRSLSRTLNEFFGNKTTGEKFGSRLGFFGVLPDWQDVNGSISEIDFLYKQQKLCNGVTVYTSYGNRLLGDPLFAPIWAKLQEHRALIFLHPGVLAVEPKFIASGLPQPVVDYPLATTRAAVDLVMTGTFRRCPDVDIILSHAGGTLPFVGQRAIGSLALPEVAATVGGYKLTDAKADFARFYYDIALSMSSAQLNGLLDFTDSSHILFGSDFPYAPQIAINTLLVQYAAFVATNSRGDKVSPSQLRKNSQQLLEKHALSK